MVSVNYRRFVVFCGFRRIGLLSSQQLLDRLQHVHLMDQAAKARTAQSRPPKQANAPQCRIPEADVDLQLFHPGGSDAKIQLID